VRWRNWASSLSGLFLPRREAVRSERSGRCRIVKEFRLADITDIEAANAFLREVYLPAHNARFAVEPAGRGLGLDAARGGAAPQAFLKDQFAPAARKN
jgi:hypothetical protein